MLILTGPLDEPIVECRNTARKPGTIVPAERLNGRDHRPISAEETAMTLESFDQARWRARLAFQRREEGVAIATGQSHPLMLVQQAARAFISEIAGSQSGYRHSFADNALCRRRYTQLKPLRFQFSTLDGWLFVAGDRHSVIVRHFAVQDKE
ncbi:MAG TPA: hypothetical protein VG328_20920 [Stellaceae bacterium]|nr:hypothetical protein [Stellaceae bacterium]